MLLVTLCALTSGFLLSRKQHKTCEPHTQLVETSTKLYTRRVEPEPVEATQKTEATYKYLGCYLLENPDDQRVQTKQLTSMSVHKCFTLCQGEAKQQENNVAKFFMLRNGKECTCLHYIDNNPGATDKVKCSVPCTGDSSEKCGGATNESVYVMLNCPVYPKSETEKLQEKQMNETLSKLDNA